MEQVTVYYDGSCPGCVRDRRRYEKLAGQQVGLTRWVDITGREAMLKAEGVDPARAIRELHVKDGSGRIYRELDAYILLMQRTRWLRPAAAIIGLPLIKPLLARIYHWWVDRRLRNSGRI